MPEHPIPGVQTLKAVSVRDVMSAPIVTCRTEDPIADVARTMSAEGIHCVVVVGDDGPDGEPGRPWRILSDADLVAAAPFDLGGTLAGWIAGTAIRTIEAAEPLQHAALLMSEDGSTHLIAVDDGVSVVLGADGIRPVRVFGCRSRRGLVGHVLAAQPRQHRRQLLNGHQHVARLRSLGGTDDLARLEEVHQATGLREPDAQLPLQHRCRSELARDDELGGREEHLAPPTLGQHTEAVKEWLRED